MKYEERRVLEERIASAAKGGDVDTVLGNYYELNIDKSRKPLDRDVFFKLAKRVPNINDTIARMKDGYNPALLEVVSIYASVAHNAGVNYREEDVEGIAQVLVDAYGRDAQEAIISVRGGGEVPMEKLQNFKNAWKRPVAVVRENNSFREIRSPAEEEESVTVLEFTRKTNPDKAGYNKYRVREVTWRREQDSDANAAYRPAPGWVAPDWTTTPSEATKAMRECIFGTVDYVVGELHMPAFSKTSGGGFKGTVTNYTDTDTTIYVPEERYSGDIGLAIQSRFERLMQERKMHFTKWSDRPEHGYVGVKPVSGNTERIDWGGHEEGVILYDGRSPRFITQHTDADLTNWRKTGEVQLNLIPERLSPDTITPKAQKRKIFYE